MIKKTPRDYQQEVCKEICRAWTRGEVPYASIMTGLGKSLCLAMLTNRFVNDGKRILQLVPRLELVEQNYIEAYHYMDNKSALGIVCSQLNKKQNTRQVVIAMASSFINLKTKSGVFDYLLLDECHHVSFKKEGEKGTYHKIITSLLRLNPAMKICGMTGTPYRLDQGELHEESHKITPFFTNKVYDTSINPGIPELIKKGYLSHIETLNTSIKVDLTGVKMSGMDYNKDAAGVKFDAIIEDAVNDMRNQFDEHNINTALIFASNLKNARHIFDVWGDPSTMRIVCADESICTKAQRAAAIDWFKNGTGKRYIVNVDILAEGFDYKALQCCVLLRATTSPGLLVQMVGRIIRPHDDKEHAFLLDYGTNCERLGNIDNIIVPTTKKKRGDAPKRLCLVPECGEVNLLSAKRCKKCGAEFISTSDDGNYSMRTKTQALQEKMKAREMVFDVNNVYFERHEKNDVAMIKILFADNDYNLLHTEYICIEHPGKAHNLAVHKVMSLLKNKRDFYQISKFEGGVNVKNLLFLFENYYDQYFRKIRWIKVLKDGHFNRLLEWGFGES